MREQMVLKNDERLRLLEVLAEVKPYMAEMHAAERTVGELLESADSMDDFVKKMQSEHDRTKDAVLRTDLRIYIGRLRKRIRIQPI